MDRWPDFFIVGAPRCGTTFIWDALRSHPDVFMPARKEPHHLSPDLDGGSLAEGAWRVRDRKAYLGLFAPAATHQLTGEASTGYLGSTVAPDAIREVRPDARVICCLRDPVEQIASMHARRVVAGVEDLDLEAALDAEPERLAGRRLPRLPVFMPQAQYRAGARYLPQIKRYVERFGRDRVLVILLDDIVADGPSTMATVLGHLGLGPGGHLPRRRLNPTQRARSARFGRALYSPRLARLVEEGLPPGARRTARWLLRAARRSNRATTSTPVVPVALRDRLRAELRADVERLGAFLGRDLAALWWGEHARG